MVGRKTTAEEGGGPVVPLSSHTTSVSLRMNAYVYVHLN